MRRTPQFKQVNLREAQKMFESACLSVSVTRVDRKSQMASFEKSPFTGQFGQYLDTETSHKFKSYCDALVRVGFMDAREVEL